MTAADQMNLLLAQSGGSAEATRDAIGRTALLVLIVSLAALFLLTWALAWTLARRRERMLQAKEEQERAIRPARLPDPWVEAGRRVQAPSTGDLESAVKGSAPDSEERRDTAAAVSPGALANSKDRPVALVTGAARRVGRAIALRLARCGCDVLFTYNESSTEAESLARELSELGATGTFYQVDLADADSVHAFASGLAQTLARLDILVHNASLYGASPLPELSDDEVMRQFRVNAVSPLMLTARLAPLLSQSTMKGGGAVVAMADIHAMGRPRKGFAAYSMSKAALAEMVMTLARDLAPDVRVNGVAPGVVAWPEEGFESDEEAQRKYVRRIPQGRAGTPEEAAEAVRWLAIDATYTTGEIIRVDGGRWLT